MLWLRIRQKDQIYASQDSPNLATMHVIKVSIEQPVQ